MATLDESPSAKNIREAMATITTRCPANLVNSKSEMLRLRKFWGLPKQDTDKNETLLQDPQAQEEPEAAEPSTDLASVNGPLVVSPKFAKDLMSHPPDQSVEEITSNVNEMALRSTSRPYPEASVSAKRKRQEVDVVEEPSQKRVTKESGATKNGDKTISKSVNNIRGHEGETDSARPETVQVAPGKLVPRSKKGQPRRHMIQTFPAVDKSDKMWDVPPSPKKLAENPIPTPTTMTVNPLTMDTTPRRRGRPPRVGPPATKKMTSMKKGQRKEPHDLQVKPRRKGRSEESVGSESETREDYEGPTKSSPQKAGPKTRSKASKANVGDDAKERARTSQSIYSTASAPAHKDVNVVRDIEEKTLHARNGDNLALARAKKASKRVRKDDIIDAETGQNRQNRAASAQHEREGGGRDDSEREGSNETQGVGESDGQRSTQVDEGDGERVEAGEREHDVEDPIQANDSEGEEAEEEELELFGQHRVWKIVLEGARSVCGSKLLRNLMPKCLTKTIKELIQEVSRVRDLYEQLLAFKGPRHDSLDGLDEELRERLDAIEYQIEELSEETADSEAGKMIRDIYAQAIPAMVFLLRSALKYRVYYVNGPCDLETLKVTVTGLREIIRLQTMAISLCEKATHWKANPVTSEPIVRPTKRQMFPNLRHMREAFSKVLLEQDRKRKMKQNAMDYRYRQKELAGSPQRTKQEAARKDEIRLRKMRESREQEDQRRRDGKRTLRQIREDEARARMGSVEVDGQVECRISWSDAEDLALYFQLEKGYAGHLTSTERYLNILNTPLLQNKLPEHIRERALYFKPTLLEERGALEWISSIE